MTQRSILSGVQPYVTIHAGADVVVRGVAGEQVFAEADGRWGLKVERSKDEVKVQVGKSGRVDVPAGSSVKVYAGKNIEIDAVGGDVIAVAGLHLKLRECGRLVQANAGGSMDVDCRDLGGREMKLQAGGNLRAYIHSLASARIRVHDLGGHWEAIIGAGEVPLQLKAGGDVTLVTAHEVKGTPPYYLMGQVEKPSPQA
jgi:hypothetical protein